MNISSSQAITQSILQHPPKTKPKITFFRSIIGLLAVVAIAAFVFWFFNIRQPGNSYQQAVDPDPANRQVPSATQSPAESGPAVAANQAAVAQEKPLTTEQALKKHVVHLATTIGERNLRTYDKLCDAADYIEAEYKSYGYKPARQTYQAYGRDCFNLDVEIKGTKSPSEIVIIGAHYDSVVGTPGANDNGSGTAAMLFLAKHFAKSKPERSLRFVAWTNEEPPYFQNRGLMGSWVYAEKCRQEKQDIVAVLSLETMGFYTCLLYTSPSPRDS